MIHALRLGGLAVAGAVAGVTGAFLHAATVDIQDVPVPYGLILALGGLLAIVVMAHLTARSRLGVGVVAVSWLAPVFALASFPRGAGDVVVPDSVIGYVYLFGCVAVIGASLGMRPPAGRKLQTGLPEAGGWG